MYNKIMEGLDLNIDNYDLNDLLDLFKLEFDFNETDLKRVKKIVMQTHPDKSKLDKKYFLFFTSAYKIIYSIYEFRYKNTKQSVVYTVEKDEEKELILNKIKSKSNFNKIFNELFEKYKIKDENEESGYGDWLKSNENIDNRTTTMSQMNESFETKKKEIQAIVPMRDIEDIGQSTNQYDLTCEKPTYYSSDIFGKLQYDDLKRAHVESVVPITNEDYLKRPKFKSVLEYQQQTEYKDITPISISQANDYFKQRQSLQDKNDVQRAYKLAKQEEMYRKANQKLMSGFKQLTN